ncbi:MAG: InlB B-repeat-containing protein, partial [Clostridia bacterium]|nr:InlB B-repeat-containing protein [Clostridia bacterium]
MTKAKIYSKKVLSIFIAILMCLTVIPLVSETAPEADAATAGKYDIKVELTVTNGADGWDKNNHYVYHKANNGTGTQSSQSVSLSTGNMDEEKTHTFTYTGTGFPTSYSFEYSFGGGLTWRKLEFNLKVYASKTGANSWKEVMSGSFSDESSAFSAAKGTWTVNASTNIAAPASISWTNTAKSVTVPQTGTATVATTAATVYDQYGVEWYQEPYYALGTSDTPTSTNATISGITRTTSMSNTCTVSVTNAAKTWVDNGGGTSRDVYVTAYINSVKTSTTTKVTVNQVKYNVKFYNGDTLLNTVTSNQEFYYNNRPTYNGEVSKDADAQYTYTFDGWTVNKDGSGTVYTALTIPVATANTSYYAHYSTVTNQYKVTFENYDGTVLQSGKLNYGTLPVYEGGTPKKPNTPEYTYTFAGWSPEVSEVEKEIVYTAQFTETKNKYTVEFCNDNGDTLDVQTLEYGATPVYHGATPTKASDAQYTYVFAGWSPEIEPVTTQAIYTATYEAKLNSYEVVFKNEDGTVLQSSSYDYGTTPSCGITPVKASDAQYDYTFAGWSPAITTVTGNQEYTALFTPVQKEYTVYYKNYDGSALTEENVSYGEAAQMADALTPSKPSSDGKTYVFAGWSADLSSVTKNTYAVAQYAVEGAENYWVTFVDTDGSVLYKTIVEEGGTAVYGAAAPVKEGYEFVGWDKSLENVTADMTVTALYSKDGEQYVVTFVDWDDTFIKSAIVNHGEAAVAPDDPEREGDENTVYKFSGWDKDISNVTENLVVKATYSVHTHEYNTFVENVVPASCTENSIDKFSCSCGLTKNIEAEDSKDMSNHTGTLTLTGNKKETCTENGYSGDMVCDACNNVAIKGEVITAPGHNAGEIVVENVKDGSCTVPGTYEEVSYCTVCNEEVSRESKTGALLPHTSGETVIENNVEADCENAGSYDEVVYCSVCNEELSRKTTTVDALGHEEAEAVIENKVEADCENDGSYETVVYCSVCNKELSRVKTTVDALGHEEADAVVENEVEADCENAGSYDEVVYCTVCDKELSRVTKEVPKLGHKEAEAVTENEVAADCENAGSYDEVVYCTVCDKELSRVTKEVPKLGHKEATAVTENEVAA